MSNAVLTVRGVPIIWDNEGVGLLFTGGMTIDADGSPRAYGPAGTKPLDDLENAGHPGNWWGLVCGINGRPWIQEPRDVCPGYYVSTTSYQRAEFQRTDPRRYLDSETVPFIVVPGPLRRAVEPVVLGCRATVTYHGQTVEAVVGDFGPASHLGEASIATAQALGIGSDPRTGGVDSGVLYHLVPGQAAPGFELQPLA